LMLLVERRLITVSKTVMELITYIEKSARMR